MSLKSRMKKLEQVHGGTEASVFQFRTLFEDKDGNVNEEEATVYAIVDWGPGKVAIVSRTDSESIGEYETRLDRMKGLTWEQARDQHGLQNWGS